MERAVGPLSFESRFACLMRHAGHELAHRTADHRCDEAASVGMPFTEGSSHQADCPLRPNETGASRDDRSAPEESPSGTRTRFR